MRPVWAEIDLTAIIHNTKILKGLVSPDTLFMAVVKANGYGHGAYRVAEAALAAGADRLGVATIEEAGQLMSAGIDTPIHILSEAPPNPEDSGAIAENKFIATVCRPETADSLSRAAEDIGQEVVVHVKIDTGMNRLGLKDDPAAVVAFLEHLNRLPAIMPEGIFTHFATADDPASDFPARQLDRFMTVVGELDKRGLCPPIKHAANSAAIIGFPESHMDMVRAGIAMYGLDPSPAFAGRAEIKPALALKARISFVKEVPAGEGISYGLTFKTSRDSRIATLPLGYADGYSRLLSNKTDVLVKGQRAVNTGTICMDQFMVDVTEIAGVEPGTEAALIGRDGGASITADEIASRLGTINYEVVCMISARVPRVYLT
ncbi:MAG: alanine racemase [Actinomycetota bacterium]